MHLEASAPWWRYPMMWLVVGGPVAVVLASAVTLGLAIRHPDPVQRTLPSANAAELPALQGRNHAATAGR